MSAPWEKTRYPFSFAGVGFDKPIEVVDCDALPRVVVQESLLDDLVGLAAGVIEHRRAHDCYGPLPLSADQRDELARAFVANLLAAYSVERLP